jgi:hypothetical protein
MVGKRDLNRAGVGEIDVLGAGEGLGAGHVGSFGVLVYISKLISIY